VGNFGIGPHVLGDEIEADHHDRQGSDHDERAFEIVPFRGPGSRLDPPPHQLAQDGHDRPSEEPDAQILPIRFPNATFIQYSFINVVKGLTKDIRGSGST
jgi:hypothetical protein